MSASNRTRQDGSEYARSPGDYYCTPAWAVDAVKPYLPGPEYVLVPNVKSSGMLVMDVASGTGAISDALCTSFYPPRATWCFEKEIAHVEATREKGYATIHGDFLEYGRDKRMRERPDVIVMNPPFELAIEFVNCALAVAHVAVFALLRLPFLESVARYQFHHDNPAHILVLPKRPGFLPAHPNKTDATAYAWFMWHPKTQFESRAVTLPGALLPVEHSRWDVAPPPVLPRKGRARK